jgi:hypothetical protein
MRIASGGLLELEEKSNEYARSKSNKIRESIALFLPLHAKSETNALFSSQK